MHNILLNNKKIILEEFKGNGANFKTYKAKKIDSSFPKGKAVIYKEYVPVGFDIKETPKDNDCFFEILSSQKEDFVDTFLRLVDSVNLLKEIININGIKDNIVDYYEEEISFFDKDFKPIYYKNICKDDKKEIKNFSDTIVYYKFISIYYDDNFNRNDFDKLNVTEKIEILILLANIIKKLHVFGYLHRDIRLDNILFKCDEIKVTDKDVVRKDFFVKLLDIDSLMVCNSMNKSYPTTELYSPPEAYDFMDYKYNVQSDIYMIGATLVKLLLDKFKHLDYAIVEIQGNKFFNYLLISNEETGCKKFLKDTYSCTDGFVLRLFEILSKTLSFNQNERFSSMDELIQQLIILQEIHKSKGVHPEVMLNNAIQMAKK